MTRTRRAEALERWADRVERGDLVEADLSALQTIADLSEQRLRIEADLIVQVRRAREHGRSWSQIGAMLGVSKQAAQRKYAGKV